MLNDVWLQCILICHDSIVWSLVKTWSLLWVVCEIRPLSFSLKKKGIYKWKERGGGMKIIFKDGREGVACGATWKSKFVVVINFRWPWEWHLLNDCLSVAKQAFGDDWILSVIRFFLRFCSIRITHICLQPTHFSHPFASRNLNRFEEYKIIFGSYSNILKFSEQLVIH